jgi:cytochrome b561
VTAPAIAAGEAVYDRVARALHWLVAALAVFVLSLGWAIAGAPRNTPTRDLLLVIHRSVGVTIPAVMLLRAIWRWRHHLVGSISSTSLSCCTSRALCAIALSNATACPTACCRCGQRPA